MNLSAILPTCLSGGGSFDPDIDGIGVISAFDGYAVLTVVLLGLAFVFGAIPENKTRLTVVDDVLHGTIRKLFRQRERTLAQTENYSKQFQKALSGLADQQLITPLGILVAATIDRGNVSNYTLQIAESCVLGCLLTHMVSTRYCPDYLKTFRGLGQTKIAIVIIIICGTQALTLVSTIVSYKADVIAAAYMQEFNITNRSTASVAWEVRPGCVFEASISDSPDLVVSGIVPVIFSAFAAWTYYFNILVKTFSKSKTIHASSLYYRAVMLCLGKHGELGSFDCPDRRFELWEASISKAQKDGKRCKERIYKLVMPLDLAYFALKASVSADMPWLLFVLVYVSCQIHFNWLDRDSPFWTYRLDTAGFGFGQTLALVLLLLPLLALAKPALRLWYPKSDELQEQDVHDIEAIRPRSKSDSACREYIKLELRSLPAYRRLENVPGFRVALWLLLAWTVLCLVCSAVITAGPWDGIGLNFIPAILTGHLFLWEALLEACHIIMIMYGRLHAAITTGISYCLRRSWRRTSQA